VCFIASCSQDQVLSPTITPTFTTTNTIIPSATVTLTVTPSATPTLMPTPTINPDWNTYECENVEIAYPPSWIVEDRTQDPKCIPGILDCILRISAPEDSDTRITLVHIDVSFIDEIESVTEFDESMWIAELYPFTELGLEDEVIVVSREEILVGGETAIKRVFHEPLIKDNKSIGTNYIIRVLVIYDHHIYHLYLTTLDIDRFEQYKIIMDGIISSLIFI
jgi:hypothetical protein